MQLTKVVRNRISNTSTNFYKKLDADNLQINLSNCHFAKHQINWLGFTFSKNGVKPIESKTEAIAEIKAPKTLK